MRTPTDRDVDVVVVGAGVAGLRATLALAPLRVALITKTPFGEGGSSPYAQGGIAAAVGADDSPRLHAADTLAVGGDLNDPEIVARMTAEAPAQITDLLAVGTRFDRASDGQLSLGREGGHHRRRIVHAGGDATGEEMIRALSDAVHRQPGVEIWERAFAADLICAGGRVSGVLVDTGGERLWRVSAPAVVLATGGAGQVFRYTTNPPELTGDGIAMAARAGATLVDLEFVQFHPTALAIERDPLPLLTEALRGEGAVLVDESGERFMPALHPDAELAPRDFVARAIFERQQQGHHIYLDTREAIGAEIESRFPTVFHSCRAAGIDPVREPLPVTPAAHYLMGGVAVDLHGRSSLEGLWACGEVSATGAHGANRLASNSLLEAVVFGTEVARDIRTQLPLVRRDDAPATLVRGGWADRSDARLRGELRELMWKRVGIVRNEAGLGEALSRLEELERAADVEGELRSLVTTALYMTRAALARRESRGSHTRSDYPATEPGLARHLPIEPEPVSNVVRARCTG